MKVNGLVAIILYLNVGAQKTKLSFHINIYHLIPLAVVKFITIICINVRSSMPFLSYNAKSLIFYKEVKGLID